MANERFTQLPTVTSATTSDIIAAVQGGVSVQETLGQVQQLMLTQTILNYSGNPNGNLSGTTYQLCWDTLHGFMWVCVSSGNASDAVWVIALGVPFPPTASSMLVTNGSGAVQWSASMADGTLQIGATGGAPNVAQLTAGSNIGIGVTPGNITISATGAASFQWTNITTSQTAVINNGYIISNPSSLVTLTLPSTIPLGSEFRFIGNGAGLFLVQCAGGQIINFGNVSTSSGGSISSTLTYDCISLVCTVANTTLSVVEGPIGNLTYL